MAKKQTTKEVVQDEPLTSKPYFRLRKSTTFQLLYSDCETPVGVSMTVPDESMDMRTIYDRYVTGRPIDAVSGNSVFHTDEHGNPIEMPNLRALDLVEIGEMLENVRENRALLEHQLEEENRINNELEAEKARKQKAEDDERLFLEYEKRRKANEI